MRIQEVGNMSYCQATTYKPLGGLTLDRPLGLGRTCRILPQHHSVWQHFSRSCKLQEKVYPRLVVAACHKRLGPVYASSGKGNLDQPFSMESLNKAMDGAKKQQSIQGFLMEQMAKITGQGSGGNGGNNNRYGGSGGGPDGPDDESFTDSLYEVVQVVLATVAFVLTYIHIIRGEELYRLARDYTRYAVTGKRTSRLKRAMLNWRDFSDSITKNFSTQDDVYRSPVASEAMWWQQPQKLVHHLGDLFRGNLRPHAQES
ncbi:unnamed protein product [Triticum turgidum subsp. durum]|uniref:Glycine-rich protein n=1 Tax=Triticum turgidum subsp. durum TaxID=4567 RepID=A0A9R1PSR0_TRITD|nr:unnamed protein product [Triticum turgidum subsp. durum]